MEALFITSCIVIVVLVILLARKLKSQSGGQASQWFNKQTPLWLPPGTVRALVILGLTYALIFVILKFALLKEDVPPGVMQIMLSLLPALVLLIREYIGQRAKENGNGDKPESPTA